MKKYIGFAVITLGASSCADSTQKGMTYDLKGIRYAKEIVLPPLEEGTSVTIYSNWIAITYANGEEHVINRGKVWSMRVE